MPQGLRGFGHPAANTCPLRGISGGKVPRAVGGQRPPSSARGRADRGQVRDNYVPSAHAKHSAPPLPFICCPPLFGSRFLPRGAGVSRAATGVAPPPGHWRLQHQRLRALRHRQARACAPPRAAVSRSRHQAPPWLPLPLREPRGGTASSRCWRAGTERSAATPGGQSQSLQTDPAMPPTGPRGLGAPRSLPGVRSCWLLSVPICPALAPHQPAGHSRASPGALRRWLPSPDAWHHLFLPSLFTSLAAEPRALPAPGTRHWSSNSTRSA